MNWDLLPAAILATIPISLALAAVALLTRGTEDWLGSMGILKILAKHESGLSVDEVLAWRTANWQEDIDTYPNIPRDREGCERLLTKLCEQQRVRTTGDEPDRRYVLTRAAAASSPT